MTAPEPTRTHQVVGHDQAAALENLLRAHLLLRCARQERCLTELQRQLRLPLATLHYHVTRLVRCGLLQVSRVEPRAGRPVRYYRAIADVFLVNLADVGESLFERLARELRQSLGEQARRRELSLRYHMDSPEGLRVNLVDAEGRGLPGRAFDHWKILRLTPELRASLAAEMSALIARYEAASSEAGGDWFLINAGFAPKLRIG